MKRSFFILISMVMILSGCDFVRRVAGMPTGKDIEEKRLQIIEAEELELQQRLDSIRMEKERYQTDSLRALEELELKGVVMSGPARLGGLSGTELGMRYYIIIGAFKDSGNARKLFDLSYDKGYSPVLISCRNNKIAVGICPSDSVVSIARSFELLQAETFFPKDAWVLLKE